MAWAEAPEGSEEEKAFAATGVATNSVAAPRHARALRTEVIPSFVLVRELGSYCLAGVFLSECCGNSLLIRLLPFRDLWVVVSIRSRFVAKNHGNPGNWTLVQKVIQNRPGIGENHQTYLKLTST
ncbi:hypothetical protein GCM10027456_08210 [Kineosporia babensis]